ncbi:Imm32 family immunity protein [Nonomuraea jabiensis]|uniref:Uncharacterized protein n=1 Tax=Nonomuraea jabiensis TaxID=882448 RepID=A0A7W9LAJ7_9ACTN|nr:hypothetical protein [Nonomuraea jabiensis]MBB5776755.1 hypothetical protein [Nonomuraea jabiensis]
MSTQKYPTKPITIEIPVYSGTGGLARPWPADYSLEVSSEHGEVEIYGDSAGLRGLAVQLLALAEANVPHHYHCHLDPITGELDRDFTVLTLTRKA